MGLHFGFEQKGIVRARCVRVHETVCEHFSRDDIRASVKIGREIAVIVKPAWTCSWPDEVVTDIRRAARD